jgi:hypothetical protein
MSGKRHLPLDEKLWAKTEKRGPDECWPWRGYRDGQGYGALWDRGRMARTHRVSYQVNKGPIPDGMCVCHSCDNPSCVNPNHLWLGTQLDNQRDMHAKGRGRYRSNLPAGFATRGNAKITEEVVRTLRSLGLKKQGDYRPYAEKYGVAVATIRDVVVGRTWRHL